MGKSWSKKTKPVISDPEKKIEVDGIPVHCAHDLIVPIGSLKPNPKNPNTHDESQIELLAKIIKAHGWRNPIVVSKRSDLIIKGHGRLAAAQLLGVISVPVDVQDYSSEAEEMADMIADNRIAELAEINGAKLKDLLEELDTGDFDMGLTGFDEKSLEELMNQFHQDEMKDSEPKIDQAEELRKKWGVKAGQIWELGEHRIMCGDSTSRATIGKLMKDEMASLAVVDPPYNVGFEYDRETVDDEKGVLEYRNFCKQWFSECQKVSENQIVTPGCYNLETWLKLFSPFYTAVWIKTNALTHGKISNFWCWEPILFFGEKFNRKKGGDIFDFPISKQTDTANHPCPKPLALWIELIMNYSNPKEIIFESFSGSGTSIIACENLKRKCRAMEISPAYVAVAIQRWVDVTGGTPKLL